MFLLEGFFQPKKTLIPSGKLIRYQKNLLDLNKPSLKRNFRLGLSLNFRQTKFNGVLHLS